jgi:hypothetical protein
MTTASMANTICLGSVHTLLVTEGPAAVVRKYPGLTGKEALLKRIADAEGLRESLRGQVRELEQQVDALMEELL